MINLNVKSATKTLFNNITSRFLPADTQTSSEKIQPPQHSPNQTNFLIESGLNLFPIHGINPQTGQCTCGKSDCHAPGKHPINKGWQDQAANTHPQSNVPYSNIAAITGKAGNIFVLDVDDEEGLQSLRNLEAKNGPLPPTLQTKTGKGWQFFFKYPEDREVRNSTSKIGQNLDIRGEGGYVVVPPSQHISGNQYKILTETAPVDAPAWLLDLVAPLSKPQTTHSEKNSVPTVLIEDVEIRIIHDKIIEKFKSAKEGTRNDELNKAAFSLGRLLPHGLSRSEAEYELLQIALTLGLSEREIAATIKSGLNAGLKKPYAPNKKSFHQKIDNIPPSFESDELLLHELDGDLKSILEEFFFEAEEWKEAMDERKKRHQEASSPSEKGQITKNIKEDYGIDNLKQAPKLCIKSIAGSGKTSQVLTQIKNLTKNQPNAVVHYYVPTLKLGEELKQKCEERNLKATIIEGRKKHNCKKYKSCTQLGMLGIPVKNAACIQRTWNETDKIKEEIKCSHYDSCAYMNQFKEAQSSNVIIMAHEHTYLPKSSDLPKADMSVIDEAIFTKLIGYSSISPDRIPGIVGSAIKEHIDNGTSLYRVMINHGVTIEYLNAEIKKLVPDIEHNIFPSMSEEHTLSLLQELRIQDDLKLSRLYKQLKKEMEFGREFNGIQVLKDQIVNVNGVNELQHRVKCSYIRTLKIPQNKPLLLLDADADIEINKMIFGQDLRFQKLETYRNAEVIQVYDKNFGKDSLIKLGKKGIKSKRLLKKIMKIIKNEASKAPGKTLIVCPKSVRSVLTGIEIAKIKEASDICLNAPADVIHFSAVRGLDQFKDYERLILLGANQPRATDVEDMARALYSDSPIELNLPGNYERQIRGYRLFDRQAGIKTWCHPDPHVQRVLELVRESEGVQAIDRLRSIRSESLKHILILNSVPLDITVSHLVTWDDVETQATTEIAMRELGGVLPLMPSFLHRKLPEIFSSVDYAQQFVNKVNFKIVNQSDSYNKNIIGFSEVHHFKFEPQSYKGQNTPMVLSSLDSDRTKEVIQALIGPLMWFGEPPSDVLMEALERTPGGLLILSIPWLLKNGIFHSEYVAKEALKTVSEPHGTFRVEGQKRASKFLYKPGIVPEEALQDLTEKTIVSLEYEKHPEVDERLEEEIIQLSGEQTPLVRYNGSFVYDELNDCDYWNIGDIQLE